MFPIWLSNVDYVTKSGDIYLDYGNDKYYKKNTRESCNGWKFGFISSISYKDSSSYSNLLDTVDSITVKNIYDNRIMEFNSTIELKNILN